MLTSDEGAAGVPPARPAESPCVPDLVVKHLPLVRALAGKLYRMRWDNSVHFDDYCQMGAIGLIEAAQRYDPSRGAQFGTFASWRITGAILNGLENASEVHQQRAARRRLQGERIESLRVPIAGGSTADDTVAAALARISELAIGLAVGFMLEGSGMYVHGDEATTCDGYCNLATKQLRQRLGHAVLALPLQERTVIQSHYFQQRPFVDIAERLGLTKGRISQIHRHAVDHLRSTLREEMIGFDV
jgi:RNA polymerase sigma factor FliA